MEIFRSPSGRVRLGWRLLLFGVLTILFAGVLSLLPLPVPAGEGLPVLLAAVFSGWVALRLDGRPPGALGFYLHPVLAIELLLGLVLGVGLILLVILLIWTVGGVGWTGEEGTWGGYLDMATRALWFFLVYGAVEEALLRGYVLQALADAWGRLWALWVTSVAFAALHVWNPNLSLLGIVNIGVAGLFLGVVYLKTASLWWATGAHAGWNWAQAFWADLPTSGLDLFDAPFVESVSRGPGWLNGGSFGPEGSVVTTGIVALAAVGLWRAGWPAPSREAVQARPLVLPDDSPSRGGSTEERA